MRRLAPLSASTLLLLVASVAAWATPLDTNLVVNGDAEADPPSVNGFDVVPISGWTRTGNLTLVSWAAGGGFPVASSPGPEVRGNGFFAGGPNEDSSRIVQAIDISDLHETIDSGHLAFTLAGHLGGFASQEDRATFSVTFLDSLGAFVGEAQIGPVTLADRNGSTGLFRRVQHGAVPFGTRSLRFDLVCLRFSGTYCDGYADSLAFSMRRGTVDVAGTATRGGATVRVSPNPMRDEATFAFRLPALAEVRMDVLDVNGRRVATIASGLHPAGEHAARWRRPRGLPAGVYFVSLRAGSETLRRRFVALE